MTEPERPADAVGGSPTPEEISARLEALLKRTHALRAQRGPVSADGARSITWPPADGELDRYDVVDVPEDERLTAQTQSAQPSGPGVPAPDRSSSVGDPPADFSRPDWSELRLRTPVDEVPTRAPWLWLLTVLLAVAALGEAAYIWHLHATRPPLERGLLRVDGPEGADVRVDGRPIGAAPIEHALDPGDYDVDVITGGTVRRTDGVSIGLGRTVVLLSPVPATAAGLATVGSGAVAAKPGAEADRSTTPVPSTAVAPVAAPGGANVSDTLGAVLIESTPSGLPVTMGGRPRGVTPITLGQIRPGRHDVLVGGLARQVDITAGQVTTLRVTR